MERKFSFCSFLFKIYNSRTSLSLFFSRYINNKNSTYVAKSHSSRLNVLLSLFLLLTTYRRVRYSMISFYKKLHNNDTFMHANVTNDNDRSKFSEWQVWTRKKCLCILLKWVISRNHGWPFDDDSHNLLHTFTRIFFVFSISQWFNILTIS